MFSWLKSLRISLPIATGASAIIATALLISWTNDKDKLKKDESDEILKDLEKTAEEFKDETITKPDEDQQKEKELDKKESEDGKDQTKEEQKTTRDDKLDAEGRKKVVEQLITDATQIKLGDKTLRGDEKAKTLQFTDAGGSPSDEKPLEETDVPAQAETEAERHEDPVETEGASEIQELGEESDELLEQGDLTPKEEAEGDTIQEEEGEAGMTENKDHTEKAQDSETSASDPKTKSEEDEQVERADGKEQPASGGEEKGESGNPKEEKNSVTEGPSGKEASAKNTEEERNSGDNSPEGDADGSEHGNTDTTSWDIETLTGLLDQLQGQKNSLSAKLASLLPGVKKY